MARLTSQQANELANNFSVIGQAVLDYMIQNYDNLSKLQYQKFRDLHRAILNYSDDLYALSAIVIIDDIQTALLTIGNVTAEIKDTYKTLQNIQKAIDVSVSVVNLGAALFSKNPQAVADSISRLVATWKSKPKKKIKIY